jgi:hypothetical protein
MTGAGRDVPNGGTDLQLGKHPWKTYALVGASFRASFFTSAAEVSVSVEREAIVSISEWFSLPSNVVRPHVQGFLPVMIAVGQVFTEFGNSLVVAVHPSSRRFSCFPPAVCARGLRVHVHTLPLHLCRGDYMVPAKAHNGFRRRNMRVRSMPLLFHLLFRPARESALPGWFATVLSRCSEHVHGCSWLRKEPVQERMQG